MSATAFLDLPGVLQINVVRFSAVGLMLLELVMEFRHVTVQVDIHGML
jgi:hypothetical protein